MNRWSHLLPANTQVLISVAALCAGLIAGAGMAQDLVDEPFADEPFGDAGTRAGSFLETDSALGTISIGVSGLSESERRQATTGDLEFGYLQLYELDEMFPRVIEIRPFALNRFETNEDSTYESLGLGVGVRFALRQKYAKNYWFARGSVLTPSQYYNTVYNPGREQSSIVEFFVGIEVPFNDARTDRDIANRTLRPTPITIRVDPRLFGPGSADDVDPAGLADVRTAIVAGYLDAVLSDYLTGRFVADITLRNPWDVLRLVERLTSILISELDEAIMFEGRIDGASGRAHRRATVRRTLRRGLIELMRGPYPLLLSPKSAPRTIDGVEPDLQARHLATILSRPGMTQGNGTAGALDCDAMIDAYIDRFIARNVQ